MERKLLKTELFYSEESKEWIVWEYYSFEIKPQQTGFKTKVEAENYKSKRDKEISS